MFFDSIFLHGFAVSTLLRRPNKRTTPTTSKMPLGHLRYAPSYSRMLAPLSTVQTAPYVVRDDSNFTSSNTANSDSSFYKFFCDAGRNL